MPTLFLDLSTTSQINLKTGIERVAIALYQECVVLSIPGLRIEPIYLCSVDGQWRYRYARQFAMEFYPGEFTGPTEEEVVAMHDGDTLLVLDLAGERFIAAAEEGLFLQLRAAGVKTHAIVYDLLPLRHPEFFPPGTQRSHERWLMAAIGLGSLICISQSVAHDVRDYLKQDEQAALAKNCAVQAIQLGANFKRVQPHLIIPSYTKPLLARLRACHNFLSVGTIEPRKGYLQTLEAFSVLWKQGLDVNWILVGGEGWAHLPAAMRRNIPELVSIFRTHPEFGRRFFWFEGVNDAVLDQIYESSICLIAASEGEGFGLPLIEAAQYGLPILARDILVFRELLGSHATYFSGSTAQDLSNAISAWHQRYQQKKSQGSQGVPKLSWAQSCTQLLNCLKLLN